MEDRTMIFEQIEKEGLEQELGVSWRRDYWDSVYSSEEARWESGEEEDSDFVEIREQVLETQ